MADTRINSYQYISQCTHVKLLPIIILQFSARLCVARRHIAARRALRAARVRSCRRAGRAGRAGESWGRAGGELGESWGEAARVRSCSDIGFDAPPPMPRLSTERLWEKDRRVAHRRWATVPRDRSRVGQRGSQSCGAEGKSGIGGAFLSSIYLRAPKKWTPGRGGRSPRKKQLQTRRRRHFWEITSLRS